MTGERLLCVDDDAQVRALIERVVVAAGFECVGVGTVDGARELLDREDFSVVLCDIELPGRSGLELLEELGLLELAATIAWTHHERWDGSGYPRRLRGDEIPLEGRIVAVADVFDALSSDRPYRPRLSVDDARTAILEGSGHAFDPDVVDAFILSLEAVAA